MGLAAMALGLYREMGGEGLGAIALGLRGWGSG